MASDARVIMYCPHCGRQHLDRRWWAHRPHIEHTCAYCGGEWDSEVPMVGIRLEDDLFEG